MCVLFMIRSNSIYNCLMQIPLIFETFMGNIVTKGFIKLLLGTKWNRMLFFVKIYSCMLYVIRSLQETDPHSASG